ncbi:MAG: rod shape-determining protein MreC [Oscillospiraceae bacterium]|nr:rod shape-determining protein MreC [Oscillospiraceae bacterium]
MAQVHRQAYRQAYQATYNKKRVRWPVMLAAVAVFLTLASALALVLIEEYLPEQEFIPREIVSWPRETISDALKPIEGAAAWLTSHAAIAAENWRYRRILEAEYTRVVNENEQLVYASLFNSYLEAENQRLNMMLGEYAERQSQGMNPVLARVITKESGNWFSQFTLDKGSADGLEEGMAVINTDGLIGVVYELTEHTANVVSIIDSRSSIGGTIASTRDQGIVKGTLGVENTAGCRMYYLPVGIIPRPGDEVQTSGVMTTGVEQSSVAEHLPKGLKIGVVRESTRHMDENKNYIVVEPYVDFMHLEEVFVLVYHADPETMPVADDGQLGYTPVALDTPRPDPVIGREEIVNAHSTATPIPRPDRVSETPAPASPNGVTDPDDLNYFDPDEAWPDDEPDSDSGSESGAESSPTPAPDETDETAEPSAAVEPTEIPAYINDPTNLGEGYEPSPNELGYGDAQ